MNRSIARSAALVGLLLFPAFLRAETVSLGDIGVAKMHQDWSEAKVDQSVTGKPLSIGGQAFQHGIGTHASSLLWLKLDGKTQTFTAKVGMDDDLSSEDIGKKRVAVRFMVYGDQGKKLFDSGPIKPGAAAKDVSVDLTGQQQALLVVDPVTAGIDYCHADWADAVFTYSGDKPQPQDPPVESAEVLTPKPAATPRINSAKVFGVRPGHPVLYTIAATGDRPMTFSADGLPDGAKLDPATGHISGSIANEGTYPITIKASNSLGSAEAELKIVVGDRIALTPQLGWNSWNCFAANVSQEKVQAAADAMVSSGLINHGWTYINVDDCWEIRSNEPADKRRATDGHILTNKKFPDMKAMADYIHSKGMRAGLYSSPGPSTCGGYTASYEFELADAKQYADWGFDYLKYDWCSYGDVAGKIRKAPNPPSALEIDQHPYTVMRDALHQQNRDILFSFCQYGMGDVWKWGEQCGGNSWRTTGDINDSWGSMAGIGFSQNGHEKYAGPGHWNDPDMLVVGKVGWGPSLHPTKLTPNEQYTHITLWCLLDAPLLIGCDMTQMDDFTLGLLTNDEVLAVNQDPLGEQAARVSQDGSGEVWAKNLADGSKAVGLFNRGPVPMKVTVKFSDLGLSKTVKVRDLWREKDLGSFTDEYTVEVARHGAAMISVK